MQAALVIIALFVGCAVCVNLLPEPVERAKLDEAEPQATSPEASTVEEHAKQEEEFSPAENMTVIASPSWRDRDSTLKRFEFLLNRFSDLCPTAESKAPPHDMLSYIHGKLADAGLDQEESLLDLSNTLYRMTQDISVSVTTQPQCAEIWAMYLTVRLGGQNPEEARRGVTAVTSTLYGLTAE